MGTHVSCGEDFFSECGYSWDLATDAFWSAFIKDQTAFHQSLSSPVVLKSLFQLFHASLCTRSQTVEWDGCIRCERSVMEAGGWWWCSRVYFGAGRKVLDSKERRWPTQTIAENDLVESLGLHPVTSNLELINFWQANRNEWREEVVISEAVCGDILFYADDELSQRCGPGAPQIFKFFLGYPVTSDNYSCN